MESMNIPMFLEKYKYEKLIHIINNKIHLSDF
ncbi:hypothetical protein M2347_000864 [Chryseobacterium sp. H1D6B]|nr:hypothetical protein [Chryseobacterium sp. H1D6B]